MSEGTRPLLEVEHLEKHFPIQSGVLKREVGRVRAVDGISFSLDRGETFGLVGESGCGKSTAAKAIMRLTRPTGGVVRFDGTDITDMSAEERRRFRRRAQIIFQNPDSSFDPRMTIGESVAEPLRVNGMRDRDRRREIVRGLLERVGLEPQHAERYPHEFSGGQKQRVGLARALSVNPDLLVADEPVSALDVSVQAEILALMQELQEEFDLAILVISHNLGVIRQICDHVGVMYLGELVERGPAASIFDDPQHPYTRALLASRPLPDPHLVRRGNELTGDVPSPASPPSGCRFHTRCPELIQPDDVDLDQSTWRSLMDAAQRIYTNQIDSEGIRESVVTRTDGITDPEEVPFEAFSKRVRADYGIPDEIDHGHLDSVFETALKAVYREEIDQAGALLEEEFATPCRSDIPRETDVASDHVANCHRIDANVPVTQVVQGAED